MQMAAINRYLTFLYRCGRETFRGGWRYYVWMTLLTVISLAGLHAYSKQLVDGLITTGMTDQVSWGVYIANFTFLVGMAAAAVMLVVPAYVYKDESFHDVVIFGELLAVSSIAMCLMFVTVDLGRPELFWHLTPGLGKFNWPISMLSWDVVVLWGYLLLNVWICGNLIYSAYHGRKPSKRFYIPFVFIAMVWAISIHTFTAFLYMGLGARPFWNSSIVAPRFLASAFTSGPAFLVLTLQVIRRCTPYRVEDKTLLKLRSIIQVAMIINVFLLVCDSFKEFYTVSHHLSSAEYLFFGLDGHNALVPWIWTAVILNGIALVLLVLPQSRGLRCLNLACILAIFGIWIEKGMGLVVPGFVPTPLGEMVEYTPTVNETLICIGIWAFGLLLYTIFLKATIPVLTGAVRASEPGAVPPMGADAVGADAVGRDAAGKHVETRQADFGPGKQGLTFSVIAVIFLGTAVVFWLDPLGEASPASPGRPAAPDLTQPVLVRDNPDPALYYGTENCKGCHSRREYKRLWNYWEGGGHKDVACEACHGPAGDHALDDVDPRPKMPVTSEMLARPYVLCMGCHTETPGRQTSLRQIECEKHQADSNITKTHPDYEESPQCLNCHDAHRPDRERYKEE